MAKSNGNTKASERVRLLELKVENVKKVREVCIDFDGEITEIRGDSDQGKTTILESIEGGLRSLDPAMIRTGESSASIELVMSNVTLKRVVRRDGTESLMVTGSDGKPVDKAKEFLRTICNPSAFRPIEWVRLGGGADKGRTERLRMQRAQLIEALPMALSEEEIAEAVMELGDEHAAALAEVNLDSVNFEQHAFVVCNAIEKACYEVRKLENSKAEDAENRLAATPAPERPAPRMSLAECEKALEAARKAYYQAESSVSGRSELMKRRDDLRARIEADEKDLPIRGAIEKTRQTQQARRDSAQEEIARLEAQLREARETLSDAEGKLNKLDELERRLNAHEARKTDLDALEAELSSEGEAVDLAALTTAMQEAQADVNARRLQDAHDKASAAAVAARKRAMVYSGLVELFRDTLPKRLIAEAQLPVEGFGVDENQILINGIPLHQLGTSQQIRVGVIIAAALNPRSAFVLVDGAESMGRNDRKALAEVAKELGLQLIMTIVDPDAVPAPGVTVMRNGEAVAVDAPAA